MNQKTQAGKCFRALRHLILTATISLIFILNLNAQDGLLLNDTVHFRVNMEYMIQNGTFDPGNDSMDITGTMNNWTGTLLKRISGTDMYEATFLLPVASVHSYRYRICSADTLMEDVDPMSRYIMTGDTVMTVSGYFNNYNPAMVALTFNCNLYYQIRAGHFSPAVDFLDVAGNFNNWGGHDVLFPKSPDSLYALTMFFDTAMIGDTLGFKFRFNGNWASAELDGDTNRTYTLIDGSNAFTCWYDNIDPGVPALPFVYNVAVNDTAYILKTLTGTYNYEDYNLRPEGQSLYQWYYADSIGGALSKIDTATAVNFKVDSLHYGKYLVFEVTPVTSDSVAGSPVQAWSITPIIWIGVPGKELPAARLYPNPVTEDLTVEFLAPVKKIEIFDVKGRLMFSKDTDPEARRLRINTGDLETGIYFLKLTDVKSSTAGYRFIRK